MCTPPQFPSCLVTVSATPSATTVPAIEYGITLKGIKLNITTEEGPLVPMICIVRSLGKCYWLHLNNYYCLSNIVTSARQSVRALETTKS